jgi:hypothetical protein
MRPSHLPSPRIRGQGTTDLGHTISRFSQVPSGFQDRDDGTVWFLVIASDPGDGVERIAWNTEHPGGGLVGPRTRLSLSEPILGDVGVRIFARGGRLGYEDPTPHILTGPRLTIASLTQWTQTRYELIAPAGSPEPPIRLAFETSVDW